MRRAFAALLLAGLGAGARPPLTSSSGRSQSAQEDGYGSQLLSAVLMNDLDQADAIFSVATGAQSVRLANAIDWRGKTVLMHAASRDFADMVSLLLRNQARVDSSDYTGGATALMLAARNGSLAAAEVLTAAGANVNAATPQGTTVLMQGVANGSLPVIAHLVAQGCDVNAHDKAGSTALSIAGSLGNAQVLGFLLKSGADPDAADSHGSTTLHVTAASAQLESVKAPTPTPSAARVRLPTSPQPRARVVRCCYPLAPLPTSKTPRG